MPSFRVLEREMVLHEIPYDVEASTPAEALLMIVGDPQRDPTDKTEVVYEVSRPYMWYVIEGDGSYGDPIPIEIEADDPLVFTRCGYVGARRPNA